MARKRTESENAPKAPAKLTIPLADAKTRIDRQLEEGGKLFHRKSVSHEEALEEFRVDLQVWHSNSAELLRSMFTTSQFFDEFGFWEPRTYGIYTTPNFGWEDDRVYLRQKITCLGSMKRLPPLEMDLNPSAANATTKSTTKTDNRAVFLVHGHHEESKQSVARLIEKLKLEAVILDEQTSAGKTIIEKFEHHSDVAFAVVLLTPDDVGASKSESADLRPRARQNVVLELGYFIAKLGREKVAILYVPGVELPSDISGLLYIQYDNSGAWKIRLAKEMKTAGLEIDLNAAM